MDIQDKLYLHKYVSFYEQIVKYLTEYLATC